MSSQLYIALSIVVLVAIVAFMYFAGKSKGAKPVTPLASLASGFVLAGIIFGEERIVGYSLIGIGVVLALIDIANKLRSKHPS